MKTKSVFITIAIVALVLAACAPTTIPTAQVIQQTVVVPVQQTVEVPVQQTVQVPVQQTVVVEISPTPQPVTVVKVSMGFIPNVQFAPWFVGVEKGFFAAEGIQLVMDYSMEVDGIELVAAGKDDFGIASGDLIVQGRSQSRPLVMVSRWYNAVPAAIFSLQAKNITKPADLVGKKLGIPYAGGINYECLLGMLAANNIDPKSLTITPVGYTQIAAVTGGQVDAAAGYSMNEPVTLAATGAAINVIETRQWCPVAPIGLFTSESMLKSKPELVQKMVRALLRSVKATEDDPAFALEATIRAVQYSGGNNRAGTKASLDKCLEFWSSTGQWGLYTKDQWDATQNLLVSVGSMDKANTIDVTTAFTNTFAANAQPQ
jgi:NitT/TauT family transport system substrate-binding protein